MSQNNDWLRPIKAGSKIRNCNTYGFDIETFDKNKEFLIGSVVNNEVCETFKRAVDMRSWIKDNGKAVYVGTNIQFDILILYGDHKRLLCNPLFRGGRMIIAKSEKTVFLDTMNFFPAGVEKIGEKLGLHKMAPPDFEKRPDSKNEWDYWKMYNINDAMISLKFYDYFKKSIESLGGKIKATIASSAMELFRRKYLHTVYKRTSFKDYYSLTKGYYGGRSEVFKRGLIKNYKYYDVNSLYPAMMINDFPDPNSQRHRNVGDKYYINDYDGISDVTIESSELYYPYLCVHKNNKMLFPKGIINGYFTHYELRNALELGYKIHDVRETFYFTQNCRPFDSYVSDLYEKRMIAKNNNDPMEFSIKILLNSLYGRWAMRPETQEYKLVDDLKISDWDKLSGADPSTYEILEDYLIINKPMKDCEMPSSIIPIWSIYCTAYARKKLYDALTKYKGVYCDTDSIITKHEIPESKKLGDFKLEKEIKRGILIRPKFYAVDELIKVKGIRNCTVDDFNNLIQGQSVVRTSFLKFREALRRKDINGELTYFNMPFSTKKTLGLEDDKRRWFQKFDPEILQDSEALTI